jgi:ABC-2 type transport system ATP-binding protein
MADKLKNKDMTMQYAIEAHELTKKYGSQKEGRTAINNLNLAIKPGELFALVGPDGAGKTTTIRILATVITQSNGSAAICGLDVDKQAEQLRGLIGYMPQIFSLYPDLTVRENLTFFANINNVPVEKLETRISELLAFAHLEPFQNRRSENLSGGMRKKLALACALIHEPKVLLLDEPTTGVDPISRRELWLILSKVVLEGVTVLISTPYMDEAERCNTVGIIHNGQISVTGHPAELEASLPFKILELKAKPKEAMLQAISSTKGITHWRVVGDRLRVSYDGKEGTKKKLEANLKKHHADATIFRLTKKTMEDVFMHLIAKQEESA